MSSFDPAQTKIALYANNSTWGDEAYYWLFQNGEYRVSVKAAEFPEYEAALAEANQRIQVYLAEPAWRRGFSRGSYYVHPYRPDRQDGGFRYLEPVSFDDEAETITLRVRKAIDA